MIGSVAAEPATTGQAFIAWPRLRLGPFFVSLCQGPWQRGRARGLERRDPLASKRQGRSLSHIMEHFQDAYPTISCGIRRFFMDNAVHRLRGA